jgi:hypothetical protein
MQVDSILQHMRVLIHQETGQNQKLKGRIEMPKYSSWASLILEGKPPQESQSDTG